MLGMVKVYSGAVLCCLLWFLRCACCAGNGCVWFVWLLDRGKDASRSRRTRDRQQDRERERKRRENRRRYNEDVVAEVRPLSFRSSLLWQPSPSSSCLLRTASCLLLSLPSLSSVAVFLSFVQAPLFHFKRPRAFSSYCFALLSLC